MSRRLYASFENLQNVIVMISMHRANGSIAVELVISIYTSVWIIARACTAAYVACANIKRAGRKNVTRKEVVPKRVGRLV